MAIILNRLFNGVCLAVAVFAFLQPQHCFAATSLPWDGVLKTVQDEMTGTIPTVMSVTAVVLAALLLAFGEMGSFYQQCLRLVMGVSIVMGFGSWISFAFPDLAGSGATQTMPPFSGSMTSTNFLSEFMNYYIELCYRGAANIQGPALKLLGSLAAIEVALAISFQMEQDHLKYFIKQTLKIGFFVFLINEWIGGTYGIAATVFSSFEKIGLLAANQPMLQPDDIVGNGMKIINSIWATTSKLGWGSITLIIGNLIILTGITLSVFFTAISIFIARVEFWTISLLIIPLLPFGMFKFTNFLFEKSIGALFNLGLKVATISFIGAIAGPILQTLAEPLATASDEESFSSLLCLLLGCLVICVMIMKIPDLVQGLLSGNPTLGGSSMMQPVQSAKSAVAAAYSGGLSTASTMAKGMGLATLAAGMEGGRNASGGINPLGMMKNFGSMASMQMKSPFHNAVSNTLFGFEKQDKNNNAFASAKNGDMGAALKSRYQKTSDEDMQRNQN